MNQCHVGREKERWKLPCEAGAWKGEGHLPRCKAVYESAQAEERPACKKYMNVGARERLIMVLDDAHFEGNRGGSRKINLPDLSHQLDPQSQELMNRREKIPWEKVKMCHSGERAASMDYITRIFKDFRDLHGDRNFGDDQALVGGLVFVDDQPVTILADVTMAPCADMFESGAKVEVIKKKTMYAQNAQKLYEYYVKYPSFDTIPQPGRDRIEKKILKNTFTKVWEGTKSRRKSIHLPKRYSVIIQRGNSL